MQTFQNKLDPTIQQMVEQIIHSGQITRHQHLYLATLLLATQKITAEDRNLINRIFDDIQFGRLKLVD